MVPELYAILVTHDFQKMPKQQKREKDIVSIRSKSFGHAKEKGATKCCHMLEQNLAWVGGGSECLFLLQQKCVSEIVRLEIDHSIRRKNLTRIRITTLIDLYTSKKHRDTIWERNGGCLLMH